MCGIVGYVGDKQSAPILVSGLKKLEYRGYDSAGVAVVNGATLNVVRATGKLKNLENRVSPSRRWARIGIGHTRWATHGRPSDENAHPHTYEGVAVVHNGIIENHLALKEELKARGPRLRLRDRLRGLRAPHRRRAASAARPAGGGARGGRAR